MTVYFLQIKLISDYSFFDKHADVIPANDLPINQFR